MDTNKELVQFLAQSKSLSGGTSLITYYLPGSSDIWLANDFLIQEKSTASNIKDKNVRKDVIAAIKSLLYQIKAYKKQKTPSNGLVLCAGSILEQKSCF